MLRKDQLKDFLQVLVRIYKKIVHTLVGKNSKFPRHEYKILRNFYQKNKVHYGADGSSWNQAAQIPTLGYNRMSQTAGESYHSKITP